MATTNVTTTSLAEAATEACRGWWTATTAIAPPAEPEGYRIIQRGKEEEPASNLEPSDQDR